MSHDQMPLPPEQPDDSSGTAGGKAHHKGQFKARGHAGTPAPPTNAPRAPSAGSAVTRAGMVWAGVIAGLAVLVLLIIFILQNQDRVDVHFFGFSGALSIGMALFMAAVAGGILVAIAGAVRILQLRRLRSAEQPARPGARPADRDHPGQ